MSAAAPCQFSGFGKRFYGMVKIRLARGGAKKRPFYHIVVADSRNKRDGRRIERIGFFNPLARGQEERLRVDLERVDYWTGVGAQLSERVKNLVSQARSSAAA
jgi:small subunit ribosomal protein S16